jgi:hypothetical protein
MSMPEMACKTKKPTYQRPSLAVGYDGSEPAIDGYLSMPPKPERPRMAMAMPRMK